VQGYLKKKTRDKLIHSAKSYAKRYYRIDFTDAVIYISNDDKEKDLKNMKSLPFS